MKQNRLHLAILFGGKSVEHDISLLSAGNVARHLDKERFSLSLIGIDREGGWYLCENTEQDITSGRPLNLVLKAGKGALAERQSGIELPEIDIVFPVLHGTDGEDGSIQGLLKAANLPFVGCGVMSSSMAMSKLVTKQLLQQAGVRIGAYRHYHYSDRERISFEKVKAAVGLPMILKPANLGSSVGVHKIKNEEDFNKALADTFLYDDEVLFETFISGREMECAILGNARAKASKVGEIIVKGHEFYSFDAKYVDSEGATLVIPAETSDALLAEIQRQSLLAYRSLFCEDFARIDLFVTDAGEVYINEINTIPGFTNISMYPKLWDLEGISYPALITRLIDLALEKQEKKNRLRTDYDSALS